MGCLMLNLGLLLALARFDNACGATLYDSKEVAKIRREASAAVRMQTVGAHGELESHGELKAKVAQIPGAELFENDRDIFRDQPEKKKSKADMCQYDFPLGRLDTNNCTDDKNHSLIMDGDMCRNAATLADVGVTDPLVIDIANQEEFPLGCFRTACNNTDKHNLCYRYNSNGDWPMKPKGIPVCVRPRFLLGKANTNGQATDCPVGYELFDRGEQECWDYAECLAKAKGSPFRIDVANQTKYNLYPVGCYINQDEGSDEIDKVFYNMRFLEYKDTLPTNPIGIPVCVVSGNTTWQSEGSPYNAAGQPDIAMGPYLDPIEHVTVTSKSAGDAAAGDAAAGATEAKAE